MTTIINALLPVLVTLLLGYFAAWHHDDDSKAAATLNKMVMTYALPLSLFAGTVTISRGQIVANLPLMGAMLVGIAVPFAAALAAARYAFGRSLGESTLQALAISFPAVPFIGIPVLGAIFGAEAATLTVAISGLVTNLVVVPASIILLTLATAGRNGQGAVADHPGAGHGGASCNAGRAKAADAGPPVAAILLSSLEEPVVWAPVAAVALVFAGVPVPKSLVASLQLLGSTTSGVSLFASGIILRAQTPTVSVPIVTSTAARLAVVPGLALLLFRVAGLGREALSESVVALSMPCAVMLVILSVRYRTAEKESASVMLYSYVLSALSMGAAVLLTR